MRARRAVAAAALAASLAAPASTAASDEPTTLVYPPFGHCLGLHRVTDFHRFIYLGTRTKLSNPTGITAVKLRSKDDPSTESDDDELTVFGLNSGRCEIIFNMSIYEASIYGTCGGGRGEFSEPLGIAADERGNVFVADTGNDRIVRLLYENDGLRWIKEFGSTGSGERQLSRPTAISLGASGTLYVCDAGNDRVVVMTPTGEPVRTLGENADGGVRFEDPVGVAVVEGGDPWIARNRDFVVVSDRAGSRLSRLTRDGVLELSVEASDIPVEAAAFGALAIDFYGNVYALDRPAGRIHKFDKDLEYVTSFGESGTDDRQFDDPRDLTLWRRFGQIFVTERGGAQYLWIGTDVLDLAVEPATVSAKSDRVTMTYLLTETSRVTIELVDSRGRTVGVLVDNRRRPVGPNRERWDGLEDRLRGGTRRRSTRDGGARGGAPGDDVRLEPGAYSLRVTATPTYSSGQYFHDTAEHPLTIAYEAPETP